MYGLIIHSCIPSVNTSSLLQIHTLSLVEGDNLTVTAKTGDKTSETKLFTANDKVQLTDAAKDNTYILAKATEVIFSLDASQFTNGGEGFVICFGCNACCCCRWWW